MNPVSSGFLGSLPGAPAAKGGKQRYQLHPKPLLDDGPFSLTALCPRNFRLFKS